MDTIYRQWLILRMIPRRGRIASTEILSCLKLNYTVEAKLRTIQRDLQDLSNLFPIVCDNNRPAGWSWAKDSAIIDFPAMDQHVALAFQLVNHKLSHLLPRASLASLKSYFHAADAQLKRHAGDKLPEWANKVKVISRNLCLLPPKVEEPILETIYDALMQGVCFDITYSNRPGREKNYHVNPLGLVFVDNLLYLVATIQGHSNPVQLIVHRIRAITISSQKTTYPDGFSLQGYIDSGEFGYPLGPKIILKALFESESARHFFESKLATDQKLSNAADGRVCLEATVSNDKQLRRWLKGFGDDVEIIEPVSLRNEFIEIAQRMTIRYNK